MGASVLERSLLATLMVLCATGAMAQGKVTAFEAGAITFRLDDGVENQYTSAAPMLEQAGFKATFYIVSRQVKDYDFTDNLSVAQIRELAARGHEIGAHTRTHPRLSSLSRQQQQDEIAGSRLDILAWKVGEIASFAYPYGDYGKATIAIVKNAGFESAAATIDGFVTLNSDPYQLPDREAHNDTPFAAIREWIDAAASAHAWLILTFHDVKPDGPTHSVTPQTFQDIVDYVRQNRIRVLTVSEGLRAMQSRE